MNIQEAVDAPRFTSREPETTNLETFAVSPDTQKILESWGHTLPARRTQPLGGDPRGRTFTGWQTGGE